VALKNVIKKVGETVQEDDPAHIKTVKDFWKAGAQVSWQAFESVAHYQAYCEGASLAVERRLRPHLVDTALVILGLGEKLKDFDAGKAQPLG
jgi:hypothetical protein